MKPSALLLVGLLCGAAALDWASGQEPGAHGSAGRPRNDLNGDGFPDIILQDSRGYLAVWFMKDHQLLANSFLTPNHVGRGRESWRVVSAGDFDADGQVDLLLQDRDGSLGVWFMIGISRRSATYLNPPVPGSAGWLVVGTADFNRDGHLDLLFQHLDGTLVIWLMDGVNLVSAAYLNPARPSDIGWRAVGAADLDNDSHLDIVFQHDEGNLAVWYLEGTDLVSASFLNPDTTGDVDWRVLGLLDLNRDGHTDLLLQNRATRDLGVWFMQGRDLVAGTLLNPPNARDTWQIAAP